jgi:hypothetical protein
MKALQLPDRKVFYIGLLSIEFYWPSVQLCKSMTYFTAQTQIIFQGKDWCWGGGGAIQVLGFGFGVVWDHYKNPKSSFLSKKRTSAGGSDGLPNV